MANRFFYAVPLSQEIRTKIGSVQDSILESAGRSLRLVKPQNLHITLHFIGDLPESTELEAAFSESLGPGFTIGLGGYGFFPSARRPRVSWIGVQDHTGGLARLHRELGRRLSEVGLSLEKKPYSPHITVGYVNRRATDRERKRLPDILRSAVVGQVGTMVVHRVLLLNSRSAPGGSIYNVVSEIILPHRPNGSVSTDS